MASKAIQSYLQPCRVPGLSQSRAKFGAQKGVVPPRGYDTRHLLQAFGNIGASRQPALEAPRPAVDTPVDTPVPLDWPQHLHEAYKLGRVYGHGVFAVYIAMYQASIFRCDWLLSYRIAREGTLPCLQGRSAPFGSGGIASRGRP